MKKNKQQRQMDEPSTLNPFEQELLGHVLQGRRLLGSEGALTSLLQRVVNAALEGEMNHHLLEDRAGNGNNRRNGHLPKTVMTESGPIHVETPRDREGAFEPHIVGKRSRKLNTGVDEQILYLYGMGNSVRDIQHQLSTIYGLHYSEGIISEVTEAVMPKVVAWQQRGLASCYAVVYLDGIHFKVRQDGRVAGKVMYTVYGVTVEGEREVLGIYVFDTESASDWGRVLENLKSRGVEDVLFFCVDGLAGFAQSIGKVFPASTVQRCIVHMVRSSTKHVPDKNLKQVCSDLRRIYTAANVAEAELALEAFALKWTTYSEVAKLWSDSWSELMGFLDYGDSIRRMIYTTNAVEALHRHIRKVTKTKGGWTSEKALIKQVFLTLEYGRGGWKKKVHNWNAISRELTKTYGERFTKHIH